MTYSQQRETKWWEMCIDVFCSQPSLCSAGLSFALCSSLAVRLFVVVFTSLPFFTKQQLDIVTFCMFEKT